ncbi:MAG: hypothetical protein RR229_07655 [Oscillospiraceae bacterium]
MKKVIKVTVNVLPILIVIIVSIYVLCGGKTLFILPYESNFHFSLITVNALFGGFLYTNYSLLIGLSDNHIVEKIKITNIIKKRNMHILKGIIYATVSVLAGLYFVLVPSGNSYLQKVISCFAANIEITFMLFLIIYFVLSLYEMKRLIDSVNYSSETKSDNEIQKLKDKIKENNPKKS